MPNWAQNCNLFYSKNKNIIQDLYSKLELYLDTKPPEDSPALDYWRTDPNWLGNILIQAGLDDEKVVDGYYGRCRGAILDISDVLEGNLNGIDYYYIIVDTETAWQQMSVMWISLFNHLYGIHSGEIGYCWSCEETSMAVYERYDPNKMFRLIGYNGNEDYYISNFIEDDSQYAEHYIEECGEITKQEAFDIIRGITGEEVTEDNFEELAELADDIIREEDNNQWLEIYKICDVDLITE